MDCYIKKEASTVSFVSSLALYFVMFHLNKNLEVQLKWTIFLFKNAFKCIIHNIWAHFTGYGDVMITLIVLDGHEAF